MTKKARGVGVLSRKEEKQEKTTAMGNQRKRSRGGILEALKGSRSKGIWNVINKARRVGVFPREACRGRISRRFTKSWRRNRASAAEPLAFLHADDPL